MISVTKRGKVYKYQFDIALSDGKRKRIIKPEFVYRLQTIKCYDNI